VEIDKYPRLLRVSCPRSYRDVTVTLKNIAFVKIIIQSEQ